MSLTEMIFVGILCSFLSLTKSGKVKVVDAPFSFNNPIGSNPGTQNQEKKLILRFNPEKPSGPPFLIEKLNGKCFDLMHNNYKYQFCPFHNITQREQTYRWNSYHGVLGVWKHWTIEKSLFTQMEMHHGDICHGTQERQVFVVLQCGEENKILSVTEPETCKYKLIFKTPYACPKDVFHVLPVLSKTSRQKWSKIENDFKNGLLTKIGYDKRINAILSEEGLIINDRKILQQQTTVPSILTDDKRPALPNSYVQTGSGKNVTARDITNSFISRHQCVQAFENLYAEVSDLRNQLKLYQELDKNTNSTQDLTNKDFKSTRAEKYKRGELGEKGLQNNKQNGRISNKIDLTNTEDEKGVNSQEQSKTKEETIENPATLHSKQRGDDGLIDEDDNPLRHLQDRIHEKEEV
ncbi:N-acetylglucosamine-1-phosphotransferase subunit gamma-like [Clytia hemisphaerica]|uniref:MRH domain-containing protein n=1 Tax=Clytia hemisphaerica TaxID=252671 RepID=A0A7M5VH66_9CNID